MKVQFRNPPIAMALIQADLLVEYAPAFDFVDRALFTYERAFVGAFNFTSGVNRLEFDLVENRPFYLAVHRQVAYVSFFPREAPWF